MDNGWQMAPSLMLTNMFCTCNVNRYCAFTYFSEDFYSQKIVGCIVLYAIQTTIQGKLSVKFLYNIDKFGENTVRFDFTVVALYIWPCMELQVIKAPSKILGSCAHAAD